MEKELNQENIIKNKESKISRSRTFSAAVIDFAFNMVLLLILTSFVASPILEATGFYKPWASAKHNLFDYVEKAGLYELDEYRNPVDKNITSKKYIENMVKTTYFLNKMEFNIVKDNELTKYNLNIEDTLLYKKDNEFQNDNLAHYFFDFRYSSDCDIVLEDLEDYGECKDKFEYYYREFLDIDCDAIIPYINEKVVKNEIFNAQTAQFAPLNVTTAELLHSHIFLNKKTDESIKAYKSLTMIYDNAIHNAFSELRKNSTEYRNLQDQIEFQSNHFFGIQIVTIVVSYMVSYLLYFELLPLFSKHWATFGMKVARLCYVDLNGNKPSLGRYLLNDFVLFLTQGISMAVPILFVGQGNLLLASFGGFRFIYVIVFCVVVAVASGLTGLFSKNHQFLCELVSGLKTTEADE